MSTGWQRKKLIEFSAAVSTGPFGSVLHKSDYVDHGVPLVNPINIVDGRIIPDPSKLIGEVTKRRLSSYLLKEGDVVVARRGEIGRCAVVGPTEAGWVCGTGSFFIRPLPSVDSRFLAHLVRSSHYRGKLEQASTGTTMKNLSNTTLGDLVVAIPDLPEQTRILAILDEAFDGISTAKINAEKNLQNSSALFESHMQAIFNQHGNGCVEKRLGEELDLLAGFAFKSAQYADSENSVKLLRGDNIVQGALRWEDVKKWPASNVSEYGRYQLREGDVVLAMDRPWVKAGLKHAIISESDLPCLLVQRTARLRCGSQLDSRFLMYLIGSAEFTRHILGVQTGIGVPHISGQQIENFVFLRPSLAEQRRIASDLDRFREESQRLASIYRRKLAALDELKKSLLDQAFTGQL